MSENRMTSEDNPAAPLASDPPVTHGESLPLPAPGVDRVDGQDCSPDYVPLVAELHKGLNHLLGKMHGLDAALRDGAAHALALQEKQQLIDRLHEEIGTLNDRMQESAQHSREQLEAKQHELGQLAGNIGKADRQIAELQAAARSREQDIAALNAAAEEYRQESARLSEELEQQAQTIAGLQGNIDDLNASLQDTRSGTEQQLQQKQQVIERLEEELRQADLTLRVNGESAAHQLDRQQQEISRLESSVREKNVEISELHGNIRDLNVELLASREQAAQVQERASPEIKRLEASLHELDAALQASQRLAAGLRDENAKLIADKQQAVSLLTAQQEEAMRTAASRSDEKLEEKERLIRELTLQLDERVKEITRLHGKIHTMGVEQDASEARAGGLLQEKVREIGQLQTRLAERLQEDSTPQDGARSAAAIVDAVSERDGQIAEQAQTIAQLQETIRQLEVIAGQQAEHDTLVAQLEGERDEQGRVVELLRGQLQSLQQPDERVATELAREREQVERQAAEIVRLQGQLKELQASSQAARVRDVPAAVSGQQAAAPPGKAPGAEVAVSDAQFQARLKQLGTLDLLTGMANRQYFMQLLEQDASEPAGGEVQALLYILLGDFRAIREALGVTDSDMVLRDVAVIIQDMIGARDIVARFGDHVFTVLHHGEGTVETRQFAEYIQQRLENHVFEKGGHAVRVTASIGVCETGSYRLSAEGLIQRADLACEVARSSGDAKVHFHNADEEQHLDAAHDTANQEMVRKTVQDQRFYLAYQPIVSLAGDKHERYEVLLRVLDEDGELVLPGPFIEAAAAMGLGGKVDRWVIETALRQQSELQRAGRDVSFYIKVTADAMADADLAVWIDAVLSNYRLQRDKVVFEIAETMVVDDVPAAVAFVSALHRLKCRVALEHYGCSSQPQLLKRLPVDILKVNGSLIAGLMANHDNQARVRAIVELACNLDMQCVAERVEDTSDLALLWQFGVQFVQGNFVQIPGRELNYHFDADITDEKPALFSRGGSHHQ